MPLDSQFEAAKRGLRRHVPGSLKRLVREVSGRKADPKVGQVSFGDLRRVRPLSPTWGVERGTILDRYYIEGFLDTYRKDVAGRVLEVEDDTYIKKFGDGAVTVGDVLHVAPGNPDATIVADLGADNDIPSDCFDCIIFTHTIQMIYDQHRAVRELHRILKPGGVLLASTHGTSRVGCRREKNGYGAYWRVTTDTAERMYGDVFGPEKTSVMGHGNVLVATAFLHGIAAEELSPEELDAYDPDYQVLINIRAVKSAA